MIDRYGAENFLMVHFNFKMKPRDIVAILSKGIDLDGGTFHFIGCSSSGLKKRSCYMMKGTAVQVERVRDVECGQFASIDSIPKKLKGVGLLFSNATPTSIEVRNGDIVTTEDKMSKDGRYNFTDGCGAIGSELQRLVIEDAELHKELPEAYMPSVLQIRLKGYKGVVALDPMIKNKRGILIRKSMIKFESGSRPFSRVWLCNYSKPYSLGYLNQQYIMLLSGLGVPDEILLKKQCDYYEQMRSLKQDPRVSFEQLCISGQHTLATLVATGRHGDKQVQEALAHIQRKFLEKISKLRIQIPDSRNVFGICDMSEELDYGECFFRPTINGQPHTISGKVIVAKNPCYFLGDVRVLTAVDGSRVKHLCHLIDCIVFPTRGKRPHPDEITGSDLDGDEYFVCWDEDLSIERLKDPVDFLSIAKAGTSRSPQWRSCIEYVANQVNMMGLLNSHYLYWAETKGVQSAECQELGQLFSRSVDASKTGDRFVVPKHLTPPKDGRAAESTTAVWKRMAVVAAEFSEQFTGTLIHGADSLAGFSEEFLAGILQSKAWKIPEFDLLTLLRKWCYSQELPEAECMQKLVRFAKHLNFGKLTLHEKLSALELGVPVEIVTNALTSTKLLTAEMMQQFSLADPHNRWCFYFQSTSAEFNWSDFLTAVTTYPESLVVFKLSSGVVFALHFLSMMKMGDYQIEAGSVIGYFFSSNFKLLRRHVVGSIYSIDLNADSLQLYRQGRKQNTFVCIKSKDFSKRGDLAETDFDRISIDLPTFQKDILSKLRHPTINKQQVDALEVYVASGTEEPMYYDRLLSNLACGDLESPEGEDAEVEEIPREPEEEEDSTGPGAGVSLIECLDFCARGGRLDQFAAILRSILTSDEKEKLAPELSSAVHTLLLVLVQKFAHLRQQEIHLDTLVLVLTSLQFALCSAKSCLLLLHKVSLLNCPELTHRFGDIVLSCIELSSTSEYLEVLLHWEWWIFLPEALAKSLAATLYTLSQSLVPDQLPHLSYASIETLCRGTQEQHPMKLEGMLEEYIHYYSHLYHRSFLEEVHSLTSGDSDGPVASITKLKVCDQEHPHLDLDSEEEQTRMPALQRKLEFHRIKGANSRLDNSYVVISFMLSDSELRPVPVAFGLITEVSRQPTNIVVEVPEPVPLCIEKSIKSGVGHWQLQCVGNVTSYTRGMKALSLLAKTGPMATSLAPILVHPEGAVYRDRSTATNLQSSCDPPSPAMEQTKFKPVPLNKLFDGRKALNLNSRQLEAVQSSLSRRLTLIHGPPGTGKTRIGCEIVCQYLARRMGLPGVEAGDLLAKILVAAETNLAVDNLARQLMHQQVNVVRIGNKEQMSDDIYSRISLEFLVARSSESKRRHIDRKSAMAILRDADVIATTCAGVGDGILKSFNFPFVVIDEATQVKEPVSLVAITKRCQQLTLIGDPEQLAPFNLQPQSLGQEHSSTPGAEGLAVTLFHRLRGLVPSVVLEEQYRMSRELVRFPSAKFYEGMLVCSPTTEKRLPNFELRRECPIDFIDVISSKEIHAGTSFKNEEEADVVVDVVKVLLNRNVSPLEMTVLTPYKKQAQCLIEKLSSSISKVEVATIDNFQGKENDVIIFSMVRSSVQGDLHFIGKRNRINVLLTRAKHCVVGVGSMATLQRIELWKDWLEGANVLLSSDCQYQEKLSVRDSNSKSSKTSHHQQPCSQEPGVHSRDSSSQRQHRDCGWLSGPGRDVSQQQHGRASGSGLQQCGGKWASGSQQHSTASGSGSQQHGGAWGSGSQQRGRASGSGSQQRGGAWGSGPQQRGRESGSGSQHRGGARGSGSQQHGGARGSGSQQHGGARGSGLQQHGGARGSGSQQHGGARGSGSQQHGGARGSGSQHRGGARGSGSQQHGGARGSGSQQHGGARGSGSQQHGGRGRGDASHNNQY